MSHPKSFRLIAHLSLAALLLIACDALTPPAATPTTGPTVAPTAPPTEPPPTATPEPTPTVVPTATAVPSGALKTLLGYIPPLWADFHPDRLQGIRDALHFVDVARMREEMGLPPVRGEDSRQAKLEVITKLNPQAAIGAADLHPESGSTFEQWGWDIADIDQSLFFPASGVSILLGNFGRPQIRERLLQKGYDERAVGEFTIYTSDGTPREIALKPDTLMISSRLSILENHIRWKMASLPGLDSHASVAPLMKYLQDTWGAILAASGTPEAYSEELRLPAELQTELEKYRVGGVHYAAWDFMAIAFWGSGETDTLRFLYHYPSSEEANKDVELVRVALTEMPSLHSSARIQTWGDLLTLESVQVEDSVLIAEATTSRRGFMATSVVNLNFTFLPLRPGSPP